MIFSILSLVKSYFFLQLGLYTDYFNHLNHEISSNNTSERSEIQQMSNILFSGFPEQFLGQNESECPSVVRQAADRLPFEILVLISESLSEREARIAHTLARNCEMDAGMRNFMQALEYKKIKRETILLISAQHNVVQVVLDHKAIKEYRDRNGSPVVLPILHETGADYAFSLMKEKHKQRVRYDSFEEFRKDVAESIEEAEVPSAVPGLSLSIVKSMKDFGSLMFDRASRILIGAKSQVIFISRWNPFNLTFEEPQRLGYGQGFVGPSFTLLPDQDTFIAVDYMGHVLKGKVSSGENWNLVPVIQRYPNWVDSTVNYWKANTQVRFNPSSNLIELINDRAHVEFNENGGDFKVIERFDPQLGDVGEAHETIVINGEEIKFRCNSSEAIQLIRLKDGHVTFIPVLESIQQAMRNTFANSCTLITVDPEEGKIFWSYSNSWKDFFIVMDLYDFQDQYVVPLSILGETRTIDTMTVLSRAWLYESQ